MTTDLDGAQLALLPPDALELTLKVGVVPGADHVQSYWEIRDATSGDLLAAGSHPHSTMRACPGELLVAAREAMRALDDLVSPF